MLQPIAAEFPETPSPLEGEGRGEGERVRLFFSCPISDSTEPFDCTQDPESFDIAQDLELVEWHAEGLVKVLQRVY